jgi:hypothetical protein
MEENKQIQKQQSIFKLSPISQEIKIASSNGLLHSYSYDDAYKRVNILLKYIFVLIGLRAEQMPTSKLSIEDINRGLTEEDLPKTLLINFIINRLKNVSSEEIKLSFELAVSGKFPILDINGKNKGLNLFGETFSGKTIMDVWGAYCIYKKDILTNSKKEVQNNNVYQNAASLLSKLSPETIEYLNKIGEIKPKKSIEKQPPTEYEILCQELLKEFDVLFSKEEDKLYKEGKRMPDGQRFITYKSKKLSQSEFVNIRFIEMNDM